MANELQVVSSDVLSSEEVSELDKHIEATINAHKNNRQAINRLVFESMSAITEGERCREELFFFAFSIAVRSASFLKKSPS